MGIAKQERLYHRKQIEYLFSEGKGFKLYPIKLIYCENIYEKQELVKVLVSVPKRKFKQAVHRNLLKRRMRESFKMIKNQIDLKPEKPQAIGFIFIGNDICSFHEIFSAMNHLLIQYKQCLSKQ